MYVVQRAEQHILTSFDRFCHPGLSWDRGAALWAEKPYRSFLYGGMNGWVHFLLFQWRENYARRNRIDISEWIYQNNGYLSSLQLLYHCELSQRHGCFGQAYTIIHQAKKYFVFVHHGSQTYPFSFPCGLILEYSFWKGGSCQLHWFTELLRLNARLKCT